MYKSSNQGAGVGEYCTIHHAPCPPCPPAAPAVRSVRRPVRRPRPPALRTVQCSGIDAAAPWRLPGGAVSGGDPGKGDALWSEYQTTAGNDLRGLHGERDALSSEFVVGPAGLGRAGEAVACCCNADECSDPGATRATRAARKGIRHFVKVGQCDFAPTPCSPALRHYGTTRPGGRLASHLGHGSAPY